MSFVTEDEYSILQKKLKRLWRAISLLFIMVVLLFAILLNFYLVLYNWVVHDDRNIPFMGDITLILVTSTVVFFFAVLISATALSE